MCGLAEIRYPLTFYNVKEHELSVTKPITRHLHDSYHISSGHYIKGEVADSINKSTGDAGVKIFINKHTGKSIIITGKHLLLMSKYLYDFLRIEYKQKQAEK